MVLGVLLRRHRCASTRRHDPGCSHGPNKRQVPPDVVLHQAPEGLLYDKGSSGQFFEQDCDMRPVSDILHPSIA
jgi:hypothetical protein